MNKSLLCLFLLYTSPIAFSVESESDKKCNQNISEECINSAKLYSKLGKNNEALAFYNKACKANNMLGCTGQGVVEYRIGNKVEAKKLLEKSCSANEKKACEILKKISQEEQLNTKINKLPNPQTKELLKAMRMDQQLASVGTQIYEAAIKNFEEKNKKPVPEALKLILKESIDEEIKPEEFLNLIIPYYEKSFTPAEINELTLFYKTPVAQKLIDENPKLMQQSGNLLQQWTNNLMLKVEEKIKTLPASK